MSTDSGWNARLLSGLLAARSDEASGGAADEFQHVCEEKGGWFGSAASQGDVDEGGGDANEDAMKEELGSEAAADPDGEEETGEQGSSRRGVGEGASPEKVGKRKNEDDYEYFGEESAEQGS